MALPSRPFLIASEKLWKRRHTYRQKRLEHWRREYHRAYDRWKHLTSTRPEDDPDRKAAWRAQRDAHDLVQKWEVLRDEASENLAKRRTQLKRYAGEKPRIVTAKQAGLNPASVFGGLGPERKATTHYAASPRARNLAQGISLARGFDRFHRGKGWGGLSYHYCIPDTGEIICGRSTGSKGAHVANMNAGNIGVNFFCTTGDKPTAAQRASVRWLMANAHTRAMPKLHRTDRDLRKADIRQHRDWPSQSTSCAGYFTPKNLGV